MSIDALVFWAFVFAWLVVLGLIVFIVVTRAVRQGLRLTRRVLALVNESPLPKQIAKAQSDVVRMRAALDRLPELQRRAQGAVARVRTAPLVPAEVVSAVGQVRRAISAFRAAGR